jgi:hypothetical protein
MADVIIFIEGGESIANGNLQTAFGSLFAQAKPLRKPQIIVGGNTPETIRQFKAAATSKRYAGKKLCLLVDLDAPPSHKATWLNRYDLLSYQEQVFFMVQEMEAWFFSQPDRLRDYFGKRLVHKLPASKPELISSPAKVLDKCMSTAKGEDYKKMKDGAALLQKLDLSKLRRDFPDDVDLLVALL